MSELNRIADLLRSQIEQRRTLAVGNAQSASIQGTSALYQTPGGIISAIATNFCYGTCLLAKIEGAWYAINPIDNREVIRADVDRFINRRPKPIASGNKVITIKYDPVLPVVGSDSVTSYRLPGFRLYAHDVRQTTFSCPFGYQGQLNVFPPRGRIQLDQIPAVYASLTSIENPCILFGNFGPDISSGTYYPINYNQINLDFAAEIANNYNCRYLLWTDAIWIDGFTDPTAIFAQISIEQRAEYIQPPGDPAYPFYFTLPFDLSEYGQRYSQLAEQTYGSIDYQYIQQVRDQAQSRPYELLAYCIQIDTQNPNDITFLTPVIPNQGESIVSQRPQIVNP